MTRHPWQIWLVYALGLAGVAAAFGWLTVKAIELDRAEIVARKQAELEEDVSRALWRMDSLLTPLLAEEAARPDFVYRAVYPVEPSAAKGGGKAAKNQELSPLLADPPDYVLLHFEVRPSGKIFSPQCPTGEDNQWALANGASPVVIGCATQRLDEIRPALTHEALLAQLPAQSLPSESLAVNSANESFEQTPNANPPLIANSYGFSQQGQQQGQQALPQPPANYPNAAPQAGYDVTRQQLEAQGVQGRSDSGQQSYDQAAYANPVESGRSQRAQSRSGNDLANRDAALQRYAQQSMAEQRLNLKAALPPVRVVVGVSKGLWVGERLLVARRVEVGEETVVQGCWLDWDGLKQRLRGEVADLLPEVELTPVTLAEPIKLSRLLATIPVQLSVRPPEPPPAGWTPIRVSLAAAWACLLVTALIAGLMLHGIVTLSERRGAFVSAVTHELRTPLTTFRMYAEMLAEGMVPEAAQRQRYLETLRGEADRLAHLVENVLQYARLERGRPGQRRREQVSLAGLLERTESRLADRAKQAGMKLAVEISDDHCDTTLTTDSSAVEQIVFNLVDNACKYAARASDKRIHLQLESLPRQVRITVRDHGPGISAAGRRKLFRPFSKSVHEAASTAPGVGLGLALSRRLAAELGGRLELTTAADAGAAFVLTLPR